jgi:hypothetical protein
MDGWSKHTAVLLCRYAAVGLAALVGFLGASERILWSAISTCALSSLVGGQVTVAVEAWIKRWGVLDRTTIWRWQAGRTPSASRFG